MLSKYKSKKFLYLKLYFYRLFFVSFKLKSLDEMFFMVLLSPWFLFLVLLNNLKIDRIFKYIHVWIRNLALRKFIVP